MVGHTGVWQAAVEACEFLDGCLGRVADAVLAADEASLAGGGRGAVLAVTADHVRVEDTDGAHWLVPTATVAWVRRQP